MSSNQIMQYHQAITKNHRFSKNPNFLTVAIGIATGQRTKKENGFKRDLESPP